MISFDYFSDMPDSEDSDYQGRIRSFPHVRGNWATFVFINCEQKTSKVIFIFNYSWLYHYDYEYDSLT